MKGIVVGGLCASLFCMTAYGQTADDFIQREAQRFREREQRLVPEMGMVSSMDVPLRETAVFPVNESVCFVIERVTFDGDFFSHWDFTLRQSLTKSGFMPGQCLGAQSINALMVNAQNALIAKGYTTTRILAKPQDLNQGELVLTVHAGRVGRIRIDQSDTPQTYAQRISQFQNELPIREGDVFNLYEVEQGLENFRRLPTVQAQIDIEPSERANESDIVVYWRQRKVPYRLTMSVDDGGSRYTGKYQGSMTFSADNPLGLSDLFYLSFQKDLGHKADYRGLDGTRARSGTRGYSLHYSVPFGHWQAFWNHHYYRYHQAVAGDSTVYDYNGQSRQSEIGLTRTLFRHAQHKVLLTGKLWRRDVHTYINDTEIDVQRRRMGGWQVELMHHWQWGRGHWQWRAHYKRGTGYRGSLSAPEEAFGEGTSRMKVWGVEANLHVPFTLGQQHFIYDTQFKAQWNKTPLVPLDRFAIGGRYTVRGFDGEMTLSAERGWYWRQELAWQYHENHQAYLGVDTGYVSGQSAKYLLGQHLVGGVLGLRGQFRWYGQWQYDMFVGKPFKKPSYFQTAKTTVGFNVSYMF